MLLAVPATEGEPTWLQTLRVVPSLLWPLLVLLVLLLFRLQIREKLGTIRSIRIGDIETLFSEKLHEVEQSGAPASAADRRGAVGRATSAKSMCMGRRILWVDDRPGGNQSLARVLAELLSVRIDYALSTSEALDHLRRDAEYEIVITDMARPGDPEAGLALIRSMREEGLTRHTIIYSSLSNLDVGVPAGAFGLTNRPDQLLQYVIDACERNYWEFGASDA
ncbi:hypothetical protein ACWEN6_16760 [Sphaerisporangium sp. NPDC004334]